VREKVRKRKRLFVGLVVILLFMGVIPVRAQGEEIHRVYPPPANAFAPQVYVAWKLGAINPNDDAEGLKGFGSGVYTSGIFGIRFAPFYGAELEGEYYEADQGSFVVRVRTALVNLVLMRPGGRLEPFLNLGGGIYYGEQDFPISPGLVDTETGAGFGGHIGGGANVRITPAISLGAGLRWSYGQVDFGGVGGHRNLGGFVYTLMLSTTL